METLQREGPAGYIWAGPIDTSEMGHFIPTNFTSPSTRSDGVCSKAERSDFPFDVGSFRSFEQRSYAEQTVETRVPSLCSDRHGTQNHTARPQLRNQSPHTDVNLTCDLSMLHGDKWKAERIALKPVSESVMGVQPATDIGTQNHVSHQCVRSVPGAKVVRVKTCDHHVSIGMSPFDDSSPEIGEHGRDSCHTYVCDRDKTVLTRPDYVMGNSDSPTEGVRLTRGNRTSPIRLSTRDTSILPAQMQSARVCGQDAQTKCSVRCSMDCTRVCSDTRVAVSEEDLAIVEGKASVQRMCCARADKAVFNEEPVILWLKPEPKSDAKCRMINPLNLTAHASQLSRGRCEAKRVNRSIYGRAYVCETPETELVDGEEEDDTVWVCAKPVKTRAYFSETVTADKAVSVMEEDFVRGCTETESHPKWSTGYVRSAMDKGEGGKVVSPKVPRRSVVRPEPLPRIIWPTGCTPVHQEMRTVATETDFPEEDYEEEVAPFWKTFFITLWSLLGLDKATGPRQRLAYPADRQCVAHLGLFRYLTEQHKIVHRLPGVMGPALHTDSSPTNSFPNSRPYLSAFSSSPHTFTMDKKLPENAASRHRERLEPVASYERTADGENTVLTALQDMQRSICMTVAENGVCVLRAVQDILGLVSSRISFADQNGQSRLHSHKHEQSPPSQKHSSHASLSVASKWKGQKSRNKVKRSGAKRKSDLAQVEVRNSICREKDASKVGIDGLPPRQDEVSSPLANRKVSVEYNPEASVSGSSGHSHRADNGFSRVSRATSTDQDPGTSVSGFSGPSRCTDDSFSRLSRAALTDQDPGTSVSGLNGPSHHTHNVVSVGATDHDPDKSASGSARLSCHPDDLVSLPGTTETSDCDREARAPDTASSTEQSGILHGLQGLRNVVRRASSAVQDVQGFISDRALFARQSSLTGAIKDLRESISRALSGMEDGQGLSPDRNPSEESKNQVEPADNRPVKINHLSRAAQELVCLFPSLSSEWNKISPGQFATQMPEGHSEDKWNDDTTVLGEKQAACIKSGSSAYLYQGITTDYEQFNLDTLFGRGMEQIGKEHRKIMDTNPVSKHLATRPESVQTDKAEHAEKLKQASSTTSKLPSTLVVDTTTKRSGTNRTTVSGPSKTVSLRTRTSSHIPRRIRTQKREAQTDVKRRKPTCA